MHKDSTTQAKQKKDEREEVLKEIRQLENRQKILENKQRNEERKARTRRLIERGAILEGIFPLAPDLPGVEVKAFLIALSHLPGAAELAAKLPVSPLFTRAHLYTVSGAVRPAGGVAYFVRDGKGGWKNHREDTTDWNDKGNVEIWRVAWAAYTNRALESAGRPERIDHRSYKRQGIDKIPSVHLGPAASQMEKRGIRTDKGEVNRQIAADNKLLKEIKARITRLYNWSKAEAEKPEGQQPSMIDLWEAQQQLKRPDTRTGKIRALQESAALFSFLQANGIQSMQQLHEKIADMNTRYYDLRREIVKAERRIATLTERGEMWAQYNKYKPIRKQLAKVKPEKRELFEQRHSRELILYDAAARYLKELKDSGEEITPKAWQREIDLLTAQKQVDTIDMKAMREELKTVERLRKAADQLTRQERDKPRNRGPER